MHALLKCCNNALLVSVLKFEVVLYFYYACGFKFLLHHRNAIRIKTNAAKSIMLLGAMMSLPPVVSSYLLIAKCINSLNK